jgi:hypothetical protein
MRLINYFHLFRFWIVSYTYTRMFAGTRCPDFEKNCASCKAWEEHDEYHRYHQSCM